MLRNKYKLAIAGVFGFAVLLVPGVASAAIPITCPDGYETTVASADRVEAICANHQTGTPQADDAEAEEASDPARGGNFSGDCQGRLTKENCGIVAYIVQFTNLLSGLVGLVVVIMLAYGGIRYTASKDNPQETSAAKEIIRNAVIALVGYLFVFAFLQYIIPGGIF